MKKLFLLLLLIFFPTFANAEDITTTKGVEYKDATITRAEPDGLMIMYSAGIVKIPFDELPKELREKHHYDPTAAKAFANATAEQQRILQNQIREQQAKLITERNKQTADAAMRSAAERAVRNTEKLLPTIQIFAAIEPFIFREGYTGAHIQPYRQIQGGSHNEGLSSVPDYTWIKDGGEFYGAIDETMPRDLERGDRVVVPLYKIGHTEDSSRDPLFTTRRDKALRFLAGVK